MRQLFKWALNIYDLKFKFKIGNGVLGQVKKYLTTDGDTEIIDEINGTYMVLNRREPYKLSNGKIKCVTRLSIN